MLDLPTPSSRSGHWRPEVLAPAGSPACLPAAVAGGADAVYLGLRHFNARGRAENFRLDALAGHVAYLHDHGVRAYVVLNTLIHDDEHPKALRLAEAAWRAHVDAVLVQDLGLWQALAQHVPELERHASTQMTVHCREQIAVLAELGATRVVLARELTSAEVADLTRFAASLEVETEHFVHGALCYSFSGQCLISNFSGCRSANRGTCAQNCRFDYTASGDDPESVLSMADFGAIGQIPALADAGVASLKIEGRLKGPDYVYTVSRLYRAATEAWAEGEAFDRTEAEDRLRDVFSRGLVDAPLRGEYGAASRVRRYDPTAIQVADLEIMSGSRRDGKLVVKGATAPAAGQGFRFASDGFTDGFQVIAVDPGRVPGTWMVKVRIGRRGPPLEAGLRCVRNSDQARAGEAHVAMGAVPLPASDADVAVSVRVVARLGAPLRITVSARDGRSVQVAGTEPCQQAERRALDEAAVAKAIGGLGGTGCCLANLDCEIGPDLFVPQAWIKALRRQAVEAFRAVPIERSVQWSVPKSGTPQRRETSVIAVVSSLADVQRALVAGADSVWLDDPAVLLSDQATARLADLPPTVALRHPAVLATSQVLATYQRPVVAGHLGALHAARQAGLPIIADAGLNVFGLQTLSALGHLGVTAAVMSLECSQREIARLVGRIGERQGLPQVLVQVHGRVPAMVTRQDHALADGGELRIQAVARDGGLPYRLERRPGDFTTLWEGRCLAAPDAAAAMAGLVDGWVLDCGGMDAADMARVIQAYVELRDGVTSPAAVAALVADIVADGVFPGHLHHGSRELDAVAGRLEAINADGEAK